MNRFFTIKMLKKILGTAFSRIAIAILSFLVVIVNARFLGAENVGTIGLIVLAISINMILSNIIGGASLVYLVPRYNVFRLFLASYTWAILTSAIGSVVLAQLKLVPVEYTLDVFFLSLFQAGMTINTIILLGKEKIKSYNILTFMEMVTRISMLLLFIFYWQIRTPYAFLYALYISMGLFSIVSFLFIKKHLRFADLSALGGEIKEMLRMGSFIQMAGIFQLFNYRLSYYIVENILGRAMLGIYSVGVQVSESVWLIGKSVAMVQYYQISNSNDETFARRITLMFVKFTFVLTLLSVAVLLCIPSSVFELIFRKEFSQLSIVISSMAIGIIAMAVSMMFSHYFSGKGKPHYNTISSGTGLLFTVALGFMLIPKMGLAGAGITASVSYTASMLYQLIVFIRIAKVSPKEFLITNADIIFLRKELKQLIKA